MPSGNVIGGILAVSSSVFSSWGTTLQKSVHVHFPGVPYYHQRRWWAGFGAALLGAVGDFVALGLANPIVVTVLGGNLSMLFNVYFAQRVHREQIYATDWIGMFFVMCSSILAALFSTEVTHDLSTLANQSGFFAWIAVEILVAALLVWRPRWWRVPEPYLYASASGIIGSFSVILASCASHLLLDVFAGDTRWLRGPALYLSAVGMAVTVALQLHTLNLALRLEDCISVYPVFQTTWSGCTMMECLLFYSSSPMVFLALACLTFGVHLMMKHNNQNMQDIATMPITPEKNQNPLGS